MDMQIENHEQRMQRFDEAVNWANAAKVDAAKEILLVVFNRGYQLGVRHQEEALMEQRKKWQAKVDADKQQIEQLIERVCKLENQQNSIFTEPAINALNYRINQLTEIQRNMRELLDTMSNKSAKAPDPNPPGTYRG